MTAKPPSNTQDDALAWFVRLNSGEATPADRKAFDTWLGASADHQEAYAALSDIWTTLDKVPDPRGVTVMTRRAVVTRRFVLGAGLAAAGVAGFAYLDGMTLENIATGLNADFRTGTGQIEPLTLPDGAEFLLDAMTGIKGSGRQYELLQGRVQASVPRSDTPLELVCEGCLVQGQDSQFTLHKRRNDIVVAVSKGSVIVGTPNKTLTLPAKHRVVFKAPKPVTCHRFKRRSGNRLDSRKTNLQRPAIRGCDG